ncbi:hypothetical protein ACFONC_03365 [Luteimonas soli]|uniref:Half a barrel domain-containing protein n=1 Tax=Luteimonas soli TaxID=1648966 RepID=A0ABV7XGC8_9GAMM
MNDAIEHLLSKTRDAQALGHPGPMSTGEALAVALILDRPDWLAEMDYTLADAIGRIDRGWLAAIPEVAKQFRNERNEAAYAAAVKAKADKLAEVTGGDDERLDFAAELVTYGHAPGYRDATLVFNLRPIGRGERPAFRADIRIRPEDGEAIVSHILDVHRSAWGRSTGRPPIDVKPDETRPRWIDRT